MNDYELRIYDEVYAWKQKMMRRPPFFSRAFKKAQGKLNSLIPEAFHRLVTESMKVMVKAVLIGSQFVLNKKQGKYTLKDCDELARKKISVYQKAAILEGAGTGAGGFFWGLADFPLLVTIKIKLLFDIAAAYGFDTSKFEERLFILYVFQLAFSNDETRKTTLLLIDTWDKREHDEGEMDWRKFGQEYRDYIDISKILQFVPGIGAAVGAYANHHLLKHLGETAMNSYRLRILKNTPEF